MKKTDWLIIITLFILVFLTIFFIIDPEAGQGFSINGWNDTGIGITLWGGVLIIIIACFIGAIIPIPVPYVLPLFTLSYIWYFDENFGLSAVIILAFSAAISNWFGDCLDYILGAGARVIVEEDTKKQIDTWSSIIDKKPKLTPFIIFLFAATPLPDSLLLVPLGMINYSKKVFLTFSLFGKFVMMGVVAIAGIYGIEFLGNLFGSEGSWVSGMLLLYGSWLIMTVMLKIKIGNSKESE